MTPLSPAAQAVLDAFGKHPLDYDKPSHSLLYGALPAALRAFANEMCMKQPFGETDADAGVFAAHHAIHYSLLAIAAELEALPND